MATRAREALRGFERALKADDAEGLRLWADELNGTAAALAEYADEAERADDEADREAAWDAIPVPCSVHRETRPDDPHAATRVFRSVIGDNPPRTRYLCEEIVATHRALFDGPGKPLGRILIDRAVTEADAK
jgi:hypothetical protein